MLARAAARKWVNNVCSRALYPRQFNRDNVFFRPLFSSSFRHEKLKWSYVHGRTDTSLIGSTLGRLLDQQTERTPDRLAYVFSSENRQITFEQLKYDVEMLATGFLSLGLRRGDRVGMWGPNTSEWVITQHATAKAGLILVNINPAYQTSELEYALNKVGCKAIVAADKFKTQDYYQMLFAICPELAFCGPGHLTSQNLPHLKTVIMLGKERQPGTLLYDEVMEFGGGDKERKKLRVLDEKLQFDDPINIQFTSGTTGYPKGATLTHHNIANNAYFVGQILDYHNTDSKLCCPVPLYHCFGMVLASLQTIVHGTTIVYPSPSFEPGSTLKSVHDNKCTALYGTPTMFIDMLNHSDLNKYNLTSLDTGIMAGSPCPEEIMKQVMSKMHLPHITICYGTTETSPVSFQSAMTDPIEKRVSSIGKPQAHTEVKVVDALGQIVPVNTIGELCTRGYSTMLGYWDDAKRTSESITSSRWYQTGDLGSIDEDGYGCISGRIKDTIIRGGENIYPLEIEQLLYSHPDIEEVQVIGVPDERLGEAVCAWIKLHGDVKVAEDDIKGYCKGKISHFKIPRYIQFVSDFPMTVTGKIQKYIMREQAIKDLGLVHVKPHF